METRAHIHRNHMTAGIEKGADTAFSVIPSTAVAPARPAPHRYPGALPLHSPQPLLDGFGPIHPDLVATSRAHWASTVAHKQVMTPERSSTYQQLAN
jgi:hypothetical protein